MSREAVEVLGEFVEAWNRGEVDGILEHFDPDCEVIFPPEVPEPGPFHGREQLRGWIEGFLGAWDTHRAEIVETIEGDDRVVAVVHLVGRGEGSGIEMDETDAHFFTIGDRGIVRWQNFTEKADALRAAGLAQ